VCIAYQTINEYDFDYIKCLEKIRIFEKNIMEMEVTDLQKRLQKTKKELQSLEEDNEQLQLNMVQERYKPCKLTKSTKTSSSYFDHRSRYI